jgi:hypothetical protein
MKSFAVALLLASACVSNGTYNRKVDELTTLREADDPLFERIEAAVVGVLTRSTTQAVQAHRASRTASGIL